MTKVKVENKSRKQTVKVKTTHTTSSNMSSKSLLGHIDTIDAEVLELKNEINNLRNQQDKERSFWGQMMELNNDKWVEVNNLRREMKWFRHYLSRLAWVLCAIYIAFVVVMAFVLV